jgi:hypothetical protein
MIAATVLGAVFVSAGADAAVPLVDAPLTQYFSRAANYANTGEVQRALAMFEVLLIPRPTEIVVDYSGLPRDQVGEFRSAIGDGVDMWADVLGNDMPFRLVNRATSKYQMTIRFVDKIGTTGHQGEIESTRKIRWGTNARAIEYRAAVRIVPTAMGRRYLTRQEMAHVIGHELGHSLGLADYDSEDRIMGPLFLGSPFARISGPEAEAVRSFRRLIRGQVARVTASYGQ